MKLKEMLALAKERSEHTVAFGQFLREALHRGGWMVSPQNGKWIHNWKMGSKYKHGLTTQEFYDEWITNPEKL